MKVRDFHSMDGHAARESGRLSMMGVTMIPNPDNDCICI